MYVIKADGSKEPFDEQKIIATCVRSGVTQSEARGIAKKVRTMVKNGETTHKIYTLILEQLDKQGDGSLFMLREAVSNLDPVSFELYVKKILEAHGYRCGWDKSILGRYVEHQVDVTASKEKNFLIECKRHFNPHRFTGLGICLQVHGRLDDIMEGAKVGNNKYKFNAAWIVTNTKFSDHAKQYARGIGIRLTGWRYEDKFSLEHLIQSKKVLPVTVLKADVSVHRYLLRRKIITLDDFIVEKPRVANINNLIRQSKDLLSKL